MTFALPTGTVMVSTHVIAEGGSGPADVTGDVTVGVTVGVITVTGDIDVMNASELRELLLEQFTAGTRHFVLDLSDVSFLDSTGLGVLVATHRRTRNGAGSLRLVVTGKQLLQLLRMTGLNNVFRVHPTVDEALDATYADLTATGPVAPRSAPDAAGPTAGL